jgi:chromate transporter
MTVRPAVVAMIASGGLSLLILAIYGERVLPEDLSSANLIAVGIFLVAFIVLRKWQLKPLLVMAGAGIAGAVLFPLF